MSIRAWTQSGDRTVAVTPLGPVYAKDGQVVVIAVLSAEAGRRYVEEMPNLGSDEPKTGIRQDSNLTDTGSPAK